jgi:hypothetical protein
MKELRMTAYRKGTNVAWTWGSGTGRGKVEAIFTDDVERQIAGSLVKRRASKAEPAYLLRQEDGGHVLKSESELRKAG